MHVTYSPEEIAFREEVRDFFANDIPQDIHDKQAQHVELDPEDQIRFQKALFEKGWAAPNWPVEIIWLPRWSV